MIGTDNKAKTNKAMTRLIPREFTELNWRFASFILLLVIGIYLMGVYTVPVKNGLVDPFYSPTLLILPLIGLFRLTCYAYRKDYHRHLFNHPRSCEVGFRVDPQGREYTGETRLFRVENFHRYFVYVAIIILPFFFYDIYYSMTYPGYFILTLGTILLVVNTLFAVLYTFSCHAVRHLIGGNIDCYSCQHKVRRRLFRGQTLLNNHHETYAWMSLTMFFLVDLYIRATAAGLFANFVLIH